MKARAKKKGLGLKGQIFLICAFLLCVMFSAVAIIVLIGMIPTIVAMIVDKSEGRVRSMTVGAMNFAGCAPFMIEVFKNGNDINTALQYLTQPRTIVVIYFAAAMGYMIDWAMTGIVSSIMVQKSKRRLVEIDKTKKEMVERWGVEVTGTIPLDEYGFPKEEHVLKSDEN